MCEQCSAATTLYLGEPPTEEVLPGYALVRATKDGWMLKKDDWGLIRVNDPDYWWSVTPVEDPYFGMTDEQIDASEADDEPFNRAASHLDMALAGRTPGELQETSAYPRFEDAIRLYEAAKKVGYSYEKDGQFAGWLCHRLAVFLKTAKARLDSEPESEA